MSQKNKAGGGSGSKSKSSKKKQQQTEKQMDINEPSRITEVDDDDNDITVEDLRKKVVTTTIGGGIGSGDEGIDTGNACKNAETETTAEELNSSAEEEKNSILTNSNNEPSNENKAEMSNVFYLDELKKAVKMMNLTAANKKPPRSAEEAMQRPYEFWSTQPVPKMNEDISTNESIEPDVPTEQIRQEPYSLPDGFVWDTLDLNNLDVLKELYTLLSENYVEDDDCLFRFDYPQDFLLWALKPPGWFLEWHVGVRVKKNKKLVGFISAIPATLRIIDKPVRLVEINFLCVHKKLRSKRVAPVLIREITRRVNLKGIFQAVYTAGIVLPKPITTCRYWHRSLNPKKLIETRFSHLTRNMTLQRTIRLYRLPPETKCTLLRPLTKEDCPSAHALLSNYLERFKLMPVFTVEDFEHWFLPRNNIIDSFVVEKNGTITDFISFYTLPSTVVNNPTHKSIKAAYAFYNVATSMKLVDLMQDALVLAKNHGFDVFNALDLMENKTFLDQLKFGIGDGNLQYYLYNWKCPTLITSDIGIVLQ